jgi:hypothetical protein
MTDEKMLNFRRKILNICQQLAELELDRSDADPDIGSEIWQKFLKLTLELDRCEQAVIRINNEMLSDINQLQEQITGKITDYNHWQQRMREVEKLFLVNILRPGYVLKQAKRQRKYLEKAYADIRAGIVERRYHTLQEVEAHIRKILVHGEHAFEADDRSFTDEQVQEQNLWQLAEDLDPIMNTEAEEEDQILQDFKRIVLPAVHPDTSETPKDTFLTVFNAYKEQDYLLMEAYVAQYRGKLSIDERQDPLEVEQSLTQFQQKYHRLTGRLDRRLGTLMKELTPEELEDSEKIKEHLHKQREELRKLIQIETEKIFDLREKFDGLIQLFIQIHREDAHE